MIIGAFPCQFWQRRDTDKFSTKNSVTGNFQVKHNRKLRNKSYVLNGWTVCVCGCWIGWVGLCLCCGLTAHRPSSLNANASQHPISLGRRRPCSLHPSRLLFWWSTEHCNPINCIHLQFVNRFLFPLVRRIQIWSGHLSIRPHTATAVERRSTAWTDYRNDSYESRDGTSQMMSNVDTNWSGVLISFSKQNTRIPPDSSLFIDDSS